MIQVAGIAISPSSMTVGTTEAEILQQMADSPVFYSYPSIRELMFELKLRVNIINSANEMNNSEAAFTTFQYAQCNENYWQLTSEGGFLLRRMVRPSDAILDIYVNSSHYAFECATACIIVFYHAVLQSIGRLQFDSLFQGIYLYSWNGDTDLGIRTTTATHFLPGDVVYFNNPDYSPDTPWYRGVNAVAMNNGTFFGHGFGVLTSEELLDFLNTFRRTGSQRPAYLTNLVTKLSLSR